MSTTVYPSFKLCSNALLHHLNYICIMDNWFSSEKTLLMLKVWGIGFIGTLRPDRVPDGKKIVFKKSDKTIRRGDFQVYHNTQNDYNVVTWRDKKVVNFVSSLPTAWHFTRRRNQHGQGEDVKCPTIVSLYNANMGGTDKFDQMLCYYWSKIRSLKWHVRIFIHFLYVAVVNSHKLMIEYFDLDRKDKWFRLDDYIDGLMQELGHIEEEVIVAANPIKRRKTELLEVDPVRLTGKHFPQHVTIGRGIDSNAKTLYRDRQCVLCKKSRTRYECITCNVGLHIGGNGKRNCFEEFHSIKHFDCELISNIAEAAEI